MWLSLIRRLPSVADSRCGSNVTGNGSTTLMKTENAYKKVRRNFLRTFSVHTADVFVCKHFGFAKGVGKALVAEAEKLWKKHRMRKVYTCTSHINQRALAFYKSLGFEEEGLLKSHFFEGIDEIQLGKFYKYDD